jgi:16S rRNA (cytosine1402-N4)-methyltransferase
MHVSVLLKETIALLDVVDGGTYVDLTLGRGGTSAEILRRIPHGRLIAFDLDDEAIAESDHRLRPIGTNYALLHANFASFPEELAKLGITSIDGLTADLGVSSPQFDEAGRGFSYKAEAPLDMRMDRRETLTAAQVVNAYDEHDLIRLFRDYGEDPDSVAVARAIVKARGKKRIETTTELAEIIKAAKPRRSLLKKGHPAKQIFQALRIEVNGELDNLRKALDAIDSTLAPNGRVAIISFQSLEDRLVKEKFRELTVVEGTRHGPDALPGEAEEAPFRSLTRKPVEPTEEEIQANHRATSAKLRAIQRKGEKP